VKRSEVLQCSDGVKHYWKTHGQYEVDAYTYFTSTIITFLHIL